MIGSMSTCTKQQIAPWIDGDCGGRRCRLRTRPRVEVRAGFRPFTRLRLDSNLSERDGICYEYIFKRELISGFVLRVSSSNYGKGKCTILIRVAK